jgi:hypothetical protein
MYPPHKINITMRIIIIALLSCIASSLYAQFELPKELIEPAPDSNYLLISGENGVLDYTHKDSLGFSQNLTSDININVCNDTCEYKSLSSAFTFASQYSTVHDSLNGRKTVTISIKRNSDNTPTVINEVLNVKSKNYSNIILTSAGDSVIWECNNQTGHRMIVEYSTIFEMNNLNIIGRNSSNTDFLLFRRSSGGVVLNLNVSNFKTGYLLGAEGSLVAVFMNAYNCQTGFYLDQSSVYLFGAEIDNCQTGIEMNGNATPYLYNCTTPNYGNYGIRLRSPNGYISIARGDFSRSGTPDSTDIYFDTDGVAFVSYSQPLNGVGTNITPNKITDRGCIIINGEPVPDFATTDQVSDTVRTILNINTPPADTLFAAFDPSTGNFTYLNLVASDTLFSTSPLAGDGTVGNPITIDQNGATTGQALVWDGASWAPDSIAGDGNGIISALPSGGVTINMGTSNGLEIIRDQAYSTVDAITLDNPSSSSGAGGNIAIRMKSGASGNVVQDARISPNGFYINNDDDSNRSFIWQIDGRSLGPSQFRAKLEMSPEGGLVYQDTRNVLSSYATLGLQYAGNYNSNILTNDRSIPDVGGVKALVSDTATVLRSELSWLKPQMEDGNNVEVNAPGQVLTINIEGLAMSNTNTVPAQASQVIAHGTSNSVSGSQNAVISSDASFTSYDPTFTFPSTLADKNAVISSTGGYVLRDALTTRYNSIIGVTSSDVTDGTHNVLISTRYGRHRNVDYTVGLLGSTNAYVDNAIHHGADTDDLSGTVFTNVGAGQTTTLVRLNEHTVNNGNDTFLVASIPLDTINKLYTVTMTGQLVVNTAGSGGYVVAGGVGEQTVDIFSCDGSTVTPGVFASTVNWQQFKNGSFSGPVNGRFFFLNFTGANMEIWCDAGDQPISGTPSVIRSFVKIEMLETKVD